MNTILFWLAINSLFVGVLWMPYILNAFYLNGIFTTMEYPTELRLSTWAIRAKKAHANAVENLAVFAPLLLTYLFLSMEKGQSHTENLQTIILSSQIYFAARVGHFIFYTFKIPYLRTAAFLVGFGVQGFLALNICNLL